MTIMEILDFMQVTSPDGRLRSFWDQDVDVGGSSSRTRRPAREAGQRQGQDSGVDREGRLTSVQLLCCPEGVSMKEMLQTNTKVKYAYGGGQSAADPPPRTGH